MNLIEAVELKHFDVDGDGSLSDEEIVERDKKGKQADKLIREGRLSGKVKREYVEDIFVAQLIQRNVDRQKERLAKRSNDNNSHIFF